MSPFLDDEPSDTPSEPPMAVYCPGCGAYLLTLGLLGEFDCEMCGEAFEVLERKDGE